MKKTAVLFAALSIALCASSASLYAQGESPKTITGKLDNNDPPDPFLKKVSMGKLVTPHKIHKIKFDPKTVVQINLNSRDFDPILRVEDAKGTLLAINDDANKSLNSELILKAPKKGEYKVIVSSLNKMPGDYTLTIKPAPGNYVLAQSGLLLKESEIKNVKFKKGKTYVINLSGQFDTMLRINDASGKQLAEDDDGGEGLNSRLAFDAPETATYQIVVTSFMGRGKGPYQLLIQEK